MKWEKPVLIGFESASGIHALCMNGSNAEGEIGPDCVDGGLANGVGCSGGEAPGSACTDGTIAIDPSGCTSGGDPSFGWCNGGNGFGEFGRYGRTSRYPSSR